MSSFSFSLQFYKKHVYIKLTSKGMRRLFSFSTMIAMYWPMSKSVRYSLMTMSLTLPKSMNLFLTFPLIV